MMSVPDILVTVGAIVGSGSGAFVGLKVALNGTRNRVEKIEQTTDRIDRTVNDTNTRLSILEVRHDTLAATCAANHKDD